MASRTCKISAVAPFGMGTLRHLGETDCVNRYGGFCEVVTAWKELGFLNDTSVDYLSRDAKPMTWIEFTAKAAGCESNEE
jgi:saccharopine dehydrogenase-like NADP-dependent oxidoreductase